VDDLISYASTQNKSNATSLPVGGLGRRKSRVNDDHIEENTAFRINKKSPYRPCHLNPSPSANLYSLESQDDSLEFSQPSPMNCDDSAGGSGITDGDYSAGGNSILDGIQNGSESRHIPPTAVISSEGKKSNEHIDAYFEKKRQAQKSPVAISTVQEKISDENPNVFTTETKKRGRANSPDVFVTEIKKIKSPLHASKDGNYNLF
jgi:hypothetical protein